MTTATKKAPAAKSKNTAPAAPVKRVLVAPGVYMKVAPKKAATTSLGAIARQLADQTAVTMLSVAATSGYVYAMTQAGAPIVQFQDVPPGMPPSSLSALQSAYSTFISQLNQFQGQAEAWINTQQSSGSNSIFSQLVSLPTILQDINGTVTSNFTLLNSLTPGTQAYNELLSQQENTIGAEAASVTQLLSEMQTLGTNLENASSSLVATTQTGVLSQMLAAYSTDIQTLVAAINSANATIASDNNKIIGEGVGAAASIGVGIVGLLNFWNPVGWIMIAGGAVGAYYAITEIEALKAQIASLKAAIELDTTYENQDEAAASALAAFCTQLQGFASLNTAAQAELTQLENLYTTLSSDIATAVADLQANQLSAAQAEWATILSESQFLANLGAYLWPSPTLVSAPNVFAATGSDIYCIAVSGEMYHYSGSSNAWNDMQVTALSCEASGATLVAIDGAPIDGSASGTAANSTYYVKTYNAGTNSWSVISAFPAADIALSGSTVYAIAQSVSDRQVYQYSGTGTAWTALPALPGPDAAMQIACAGGTVFALTCNSQFVFQYNSSNSTWSQVGSYTCASITGNGNKLGIVDTQNNAYVYDPTVGGSPLAAGACVESIAQLTDGTQFRVSTLNLGLWYADTNVNPITYTCLETNATGVFTSDTNQTYYADNEGNLYSITSSGSTTQLPALPNS